MLAPYILHRWWSATAADIISHPAVEADIEALEARYSITLPADFRSYLLAGMPVAENWDAEDGNWWPFENLKVIPETRFATDAATIAATAATHLLFLDYHDRAWAWAISCGSDVSRGKIALIGSERDGYVANDFSEFVERYTTDWMSISRVKRFKLWR